VRWVGHITLKSEIRDAYKILVEIHERRENLEDLGVNGRIMSECVIEKQSGKL
jgi:hypothetical protein